MNREEEQRIIEEKFQRLLNDLTPVATQKELELVHSAFDLLKKKCAEKKRGDDHLYVSHPLEVAHLAVDQIGLGATSVIAALLHNIPYKCDVPVQQIEKKFGSTVALIIREYKQVSDIHVDKPSLFSENFRNLLLSLDRIYVSYSLNWPIVFILCVR